MFEFLTQSTWADRIGWVLVHSLWQFALAVPLALVLQRLAAVPGNHSVPGIARRNGHNGRRAGHDLAVAVVYRDARGGSQVQPGREL